MKFNRAYISLGAAVIIQIAAVASGLNISDLRGGREITMIIPALPDSLSKECNPFTKGGILSSIKPLSESGWLAQRDDFTTLQVDSAETYILSCPSDSNRVIVRRYVGRIRPEGYFSGKLSVDVAGAAKGYVNGKEVVSRMATDSIAGNIKGNISLEPYQDALIEIDVLTDNLTQSPTMRVDLIPSAGSEDVKILMDSAGKRLFNIESTVIGSRVSASLISPDGKYVMQTISTSENGVDYDYITDIIDVVSGYIIASNLDRNSGWLTSKGSTLRYNRKNADGTFNIMTLEVPSMKEGVLASGLPVEAMGYTLSPDEKFIIFSNEVKGHDESGVMRRLQSPDDRQPGKRNRRYLSMINFAEGIARPLTYGGNSTYLLDISPDSRRILYSSTRENPSEFPFYDVKLIELDLASLRTDTLPGADTSLTGAIYSPDGKEIFIMSGPNSFDGIGLNAGSHQWGNEYDIQGYIMNPKSHEVRAMTRDFNPSITDPVVWDRSDGKLYFIGVKGFDRRIYSLDPKSGKITEIPSEVDFIRGFTIASKRGNIIVYNGMSYDYAGREYLLDLKKGVSRLLADPLSPTFEDIKLGHSEMWQFRASDGTIIDGTLTFPPDFNPDKKYPMITYYYGGTTPNTHTNHSPYSTNLFASRGYIVYSLNPSGTIGYGQEFSARHINAWGDRTAEDIIEGVESLCDAYSFIDREKIGCIGASYGGFMTQLLQTKTDLFAAAVSHAGISNITSYWGEGYWGVTYNAVAATGSYPWNNPKLFTEHSPLFNADKIHTPLLLLHGSVDTNVPIGESIQLYNALKILGRDVEFITVDKENHIIMDFQKRKEWHSTIMAWFEKWLKGDSRWWDSIYKK